MRKTLSLLALPAMLIGIAACGSSAKSSTSTTTKAVASSTTAAAAPASAKVVIATRTISGLGAVLVNAQGKTLYAFVPDNAKKVTCVGGCAAAWPPVMLPSGAKPAAGAGVKASLLGSDPDPSGGSVVTYGGWPLYTYVADSGPGVATGQALNSSGGLWYVLSPAGALIKKKA